MELFFVVRIPTAAKGFVELHQVCRDAGLAGGKLQLDGVEAALGDQNAEEIAEAAGVELLGEIDGALVGGDCISQDLRAILVLGVGDQGVFHIRKTLQDGTLVRQQSLLLQGIGDSDLVNQLIGVEDVPSDGWANRPVSTVGTGDEAETSALLAEGAGEEKFWEEIRDGDADVGVGFGQ